MSAAARMRCMLVCAGAASYCILGWCNSAAHHVRVVVSKQSSSVNDCPHDNDTAKERWEGRDVTHPHRSCCWDQRAYRYASGLVRLGDSTLESTVPLFLFSFAFGSTRVKMVHHNCARRVHAHVERAQDDNNCAVITKCSKPYRGLVPERVMCYTHFVILTVRGT